LKLISAVSAIVEAIFIFFSSWLYRCPSFSEGVLIVVAVTGLGYSIVWFFHGFLQGFTLP
jgi:hypothetical protein